MPRREFAAVNLPPVTQTLPSFAEAKGYLLLNELKQARRRALEADNDLSTTTMWSLDPKQNAVNYQRMPARLF